MTDRPPHRVGTPAQHVNLTGMFFPWSDDQPVLLAMGGTTAFYLPVFSTPDKLEAFMTVIDVAFERIKQIQDGHEFLSSIPTTIAPGILLHIAIDPYRHESGSNRFVQLMRD